MNYTQKQIQEVADLITKAMETKGVAWLQPFSAGTRLGSPNLPKNIRGTFYSGINTLILSLKGGAYASNTWATFKQINEAGGRINKGEKGTHVCYYGTAFNKVEGEEKNSSYRFLKFYNVFNLSQTDLKKLVTEEVEKRDKPAVKPKNMVERLSDIDTFVTETGANIQHKNAGRCYYVPSEDYINMSPLDTWKQVNGTSKEELYYGVLLHELTHWSGHKSRLDRDMQSSFGSESYAFEELIAEYSSGILCNLLGISKKPSNQHAAYLNTWIKRIKKEPKAIFKAVAAAQKAINYLDSLQGVSLKKADIKKAA